MIQKSPSLAVLSLAILLAVTGCKTTNIPVVGQSVDSLTGDHDETEARLSTAAASAVAQGKTQEALALYEKLYTYPSAGILSSASPSRDNQGIALNYAQLLRKTGHADRALDVLRPFVENRHGKIEDGVTPIMLNEYAAINIELGNLAKAEKLLNNVLEDEKASSFHADAYNLLGIVLDAQGQHKEAEQSFRQALDGWKGDKTSVMNNLAVCLASEGMFDESLRTLRQALVMAPDKQEIARNIQMVSELRQSIVPTAPVDIKEKK